MKELMQSMTPEQAAQAFFGQDEASFAQTIANLTAGDPRLVKAFEKTRKRFIESES